MELLFAFIIGIASSVAATILAKWWIDRSSVRFTFGRVMSDIEALHSKLKQDTYVPDLIVGVDRNGSIIATILSGYFAYQTAFSIATVNERRPDGSRNVSIPESHLPRPELLAGKKILIVICFNGSGSSLEAVYQTLSQPPFYASEIRLAALYSSISPRQKPQYFAREAGREVGTSIEKIIDRMPWMTKGWQHVFGSERLKDK